MEKKEHFREIPILSNDYVTCYSDYMIIHWYYFPFGNKKVRYDQIRSSEFHSTDEFGMFNCKLWGMSFSPVWWHCDMNRLGRKYYIILHTNQWPSIGLTMNDNDTVNVYNFIRQKMFSNQFNNEEKKLSHFSTENNYCAENKF